MEREESFGLFGGVVFVEEIEAVARDVFDDAFRLVRRGCIGGG